MKTATVIPCVTGENPASIELAVPAVGITLNGIGLQVNGGVIEPTDKGSATPLSFTGVTLTNAPGCRARNVGGTFGTPKP